MAFTVGDRDVRPLTADEVLAMVDAGILSEDEPVELLHGVLTHVSPKSPAHETVKERLGRWLAPGVVAGTHAVRFEAPLVVPDRTSLPEPDIAVVPAGLDPTQHPDTALLVVEVAWSSLRTDIAVKPALYASAGVPELWVVDVEGRCVRTFRDARAGGYASERTWSCGDVLRALLVEAAPLAVDELLAGL